LSDTKSMSLKYEPCSEPLYISAKYTYGVITLIYLGPQLRPILSQGAGESRIVDFGDT
jgi:hypothetical protein